MAPAANYGGYSASCGSPRDMEHNRRTVHAEGGSASSFASSSAHQPSSLQRKAALPKLQSKPRHYFDSADYQLARQSGDPLAVAEAVLPPPAQLPVVRAYSGSAHPGPSRLSNVSH